MPLSTYEGPTMGGLLARARAELGPDAVIVDVQQYAGRVVLIAADAETATAAPVKPAPQPAPKAKLDIIEEAPPNAAVFVRAPKSRPIVLAFVGPTGAGKTTTVAKLATHSRVFAGRKPGIINLDTYRVGATEQITTYAELGKVPVHSVHDAESLREALKVLSRCDVLLVDCPGRGPRLERDQTTIKALLDVLRPAERHLVLPVGTQPSLVRRTISHFAPFGITHLLPTKIDEMPDDWILFDVAAEMNVPMRWLTDGQSIPHDVRSATPRLEAVRAGRRGRQSPAIATVGVA